MHQPVRCEVVVGTISVGISASLGSISPRPESTVAWADERRREAQSVSRLRRTKPMGQNLLAPL